MAVPTPQHLPCAVHTACSTQPQLRLALQWVPFMHTQKYTKFTPYPTVALPKTRCRVFCSEQKNKLWEGGQNGSGRSSAHTFGFRSMFWGDRFTPQFSFQEQQRHTAPFLQCSPSKNLEDGTEKGILRQAQKLLVRTVPKQKPASEQAHIQVPLQHSHRNTKNTYFLKYEPFLPLLAIYG